MKQGNRHDYPLAPFEIHQNPFQTCQSIAFDANSLAQFEIGPGFRYRLLGEELGRDRLLQLRLA